MEVQIKIILNPNRRFQIHIILKLLSLTLNLLSYYYLLS